MQKEWHTATKPLKKKINFIDNRGLFFLQIGKNRWYLRPPKSDTAPDGVIRTAMKSCIHRNPAPLDKRPLRPPKLFQTKTSIFSFGCLRGLWSGWVGCLWMQLFMAVPIGRRVRLWRPEISRICPLQLSPILGSSPPPWRPCSHIPCFLNFILHLPSSGADYFDNDCSLTLLWRAL